MSRQPYLQRAARSDLRQAFEWYEFQGFGLGERFLVSFEKAAARLAANPQAFPIRFDPLRGVHMERFPYLIFFSIHPEQVVVHAVFHTSRNPKILQSRLSEGLS